MSSTGDTARGPARACHECMRRSWLLAELSPLLDYQANDLPRLMELLSFEDGELMKAMAGRRVAELNARHASRPRGASSRASRRGDLSPRPPVPARAAQSRGSAHAPRPRRRRGLGGAHGGTCGRDRRHSASQRLRRRDGKEPRTGTRRQRGDGTSSLGDGISAAAHAGALEVGGRTIAVAGDGLGLAMSGRRRGRMSA